VLLRHVDLEVQVAMAKQPPPTLDERIREALQAIPFAMQATSRMGMKAQGALLRSGKPIELVDLAPWLEAMSEVLVEHVSRCDSEHKQLLQLQHDIAGMRRLFGTGDGGAM
jgi:hypothetical protein